MAQTLTPVAHHRFLNEAISNKVCEIPTVVRKKVCFHCEIHLNALFK